MHSGSDPLLIGVVATDGTAFDAQRKVVVANFGRSFLGGSGAYNARATRIGRLITFGAGKVVET